MNPIEFYQLDDAIYNDTTTHYFLNQSCIDSPQEVPSVSPPPEPLKEELKEIVNKPKSTTKRKNIYPRVYCERKRRHEIKQEMEKLRSLIRTKMSDAQRQKLTKLAILRMTIDQMEELLDYKRRTSQKSLN